MHSDMSKPNKMIKGWHIAGLVVFLFMMFLIYKLTGVSPMSGFHTDIRLSEISFIPFDGIRSVMSSGWDFYAITNVFGNMILFMPIGFFFPLLWTKYQKDWKTIVSGFLISLFIECSQLFLIRGTDVDDLILNTTGAVLGYLVYKLFHLIFPKFSSKFSMEKGTFSSRVMLVVCTLLPYMIVVILGFIEAVKFGVKIHF